MSRLKRLLQKIETSNSQQFEPKSSRCESIDGLTRFISAFFFVAPALSSSPFVRRLFSSLFSHFFADSVKVFQAIKFNSARSVNVFFFAHVSTGRTLSAIVFICNKSFGSILSSSSNVWRFSIVIINSLLFRYFLNTLRGKAEKLSFQVWRRKR